MKSKIYKQAHGLVVGLALAVIGVVASQAATMTQSANVVSSGTSSMASVQKFDTSLGTLNSVTINYDLTANFWIRFFNFSTSAQTATIASNVLSLRGHKPDAFSFLGTENQSLGSSEFGGDYAIAPARTIGSTTIPSTTNLDLGLSLTRSYNSNGITVGSITILDFNPNTYAGSGNFDFNFTLALLSPLALSGFQPLIPPSAPTLTGTVTATYHYTEALTAVPVPAGLMLMLTALGGLGFVGLRRRKAA